MTPDHISLARSLLYSLLADIRREAVPLVDAFDVPDEILNSALGRYDGDVYTHLYEWAQRAPRNKKKVTILFPRFFISAIKPKFNVGLLHHKLHVLYNTCMYVRVFAVPRVLSTRVLGLGACSTCSALGAYSAVIVWTTVIQ